MQQWHFDVQHELPDHTVVTVSYVGSKGTMLGRQRDLNQLFPLVGGGQSVSARPGDQFQRDCRSVSRTSDDPNVTGVVNGNTITGQAAINLQTACANDPNPYRPYYGIGTITRLGESRVLHLPRAASFRPQECWISEPDCGVHLQPLD